MDHKTNMGRQYNRLRLPVIIFTVLLGGLSLVSNAAAQSSASTSYRLDSSVNNSFGGSVSSTSYGLVNSGGESAIGEGASGSYIIGAGYTSQLQQSIQLTASSSVTIPNVTPGISKTATTVLSIATDAPSYNILVNQDHNLQAGANTIPALSGSIASPLTWVESSTKGLGFTLTSTNATAIPGKWSSGNAYAALPASATTFYQRTGYGGGQVDTLTVRFRLDVAASQPTANYSNTATWTATIVP